MIRSLKVRTLAAAVLAVCAVPGSGAAKPAQYGNIQLAFEPNRGQTSPEARYLARGGNYAMFFRDNGAVLKLAVSGPKGRHSDTEVLGFRWVGADKPVLGGEIATGGYSNYLTGRSSSEWKTNIPHYAKLRYRGLYPGIDLVYYGKNGELEYDLVVAPGKSPERIGLRVDGAKGLRIEDGDLVIATRSGDLRHRRPVVYQEIAGVRRPVEARYRIDADRTVRFEVGEYDRSRTLVIDPTIAYGLYAGGSSVEQADDIAVDPTGAAYIVGQTLSSDFPVLNGGQMVRNGPVDAFVFKMNPAGTTLVYSTFLGGSAFDAARGVAVDAGGSVYVTGETNSTNFPAFAPLRTTLNGPIDAFLTKLTPAGTAVSFSTYLGGSQGDEGLDVAIDSAYNVYVGGKTNSPDLHNALNTMSGATDGFVAKVNANGQSIAFTRYVGGSGADNVYGIAVNDASIFAVGDTSSTNLTGGAFQPSSGGSNDAFLSRISTTGSFVFWAYLGGSGSEVAEAVALDAAGNPVITGYTNSSNFPMASPVQGTYNGGSLDAFVTKVSASGSSLIFSTYLGGSNEDRAYSVAVDSQQAIVVAGDTLSANFPVLASVKAPPPGTNYDAFVTKYHPAGTSYLFSSLFGGNAADRAFGVAVDGASGVYITGLTTSTDLPVTINTSVRVQDAFLFKLTSNCAYSFVPSSLSFTATGGNQQITINTGAECAWTATTGSSFLSFSSATQGAGGGTVQVTASANAGGTRSGSIVIGNVSIPVTQAGNGCTYSLSPTSANAPAAGTAGSAAVTTQTGCGWNAVSNSSWITVTTSSGSGPGNVNYTVAANSSGSLRTGSINVSGQTLTITQAANAALFQFSVGTYNAGVWRLDSDKSFSQSAGDKIFAWGNANAKPALGDWNGDGRTSVAVYDQGTWYIDANGSGGAMDPEDIIVAWGNAGSTPVPGDWNGDGITDLGVWNNGAFFLDLNGNRQLDPGEAFNWGPSNAIPVAGDWNGNGKSKIGVFDPSNGHWTIDLNGDTVFTGADRHFHFGSPGEIPVVGDWSGNGVSKVGIFKDGKWILDVNGSFAFDAGDFWFAWGGAGAKPVVGDWNSSGVTKVGVYEDKNGAGTFTLDFNGNRVFEVGTDKFFHFSNPADITVSGRW